MRELMLLQTNDKYSAKNVAALSVFLAAILVCGLLERMLPFDFAIPGVRLGLPNVAVLIAIYTFDFSKVFLLVMLKSVMLLLFTGNVTAFFYGLSGSVLSFLAMELILFIFKDRCSPIGISVTGAVFHNIGQILIASWLLNSAYVATYLPILIISGVISGALVGAIVKLALPMLKKHLTIWKL